MKKYEYRYERVRVETLLFIGLTDELNEHRKIIDEYAEKGWRYVGNIPVIQNNEGRVLEFDLIFERKTAG